MTRGFRVREPGPDGPEKRQSKLYENSVLQRIVKISLPCLHRFSFNSNLKRFTDNRLLRRLTGIVVSDCTRKEIKDMIKNVRKT